MKVFKIMALIGVMMFMWSHSNAMEIQWPRSSWTDSEIKRIVKLPVKEIIQYWKSFWSQVRPDDLYNTQEVSAWDARVEEWRKEVAKAYKENPEQCERFNYPFDPRRRFNAGQFRNDVYQHIAGMLQGGIIGGMDFNSLTRMKSIEMLGMEVLRYGRVNENNMFVTEKREAEIIGGPALR